MSTETPRETITDGSAPSARQDELAVAAVRGGDAERYRELVERYERLVYAVAWSRLGDAGLAEEAAQETFVRAYQRLALLGEGGKFGAWVAAIARHMAVSLGLRHRRELNRRERWQLEQPQVQEAAGGKETEKREILREALAGMPENQRECLVLFYLEEKSTAEAAEALGISEAALRVRLHRARAALREKLEENLGESLRQLRPGKSVVPGVMAVVLSSSAAKTAGGAGVGAAVLAWLGKVLPVKVAGAVVGVGSMAGWLLVAAVTWAPVFILLWGSRRSQLRQFQDPAGFRALRYVQVREKLYLLVFTYVLLSTLTKNTKYAWVSMALPLAFVFVQLFVFLWRIRQSWLKEWRMLGQVVIILAIFSMFLIVSANPAGRFNGWPVIVMSAIGMVVIFALSPKRSPQEKLEFERLKKLSARMDENLFLRAAEGLLKTAETAPAPVAKIPVTAGERKAFADYLKDNFLAGEWRQTERGWEAELPKIDVLSLPWVVRRSAVTLRNDGGVEAKLSSADAAALGVWREPGRQTEIEREVAAAVAAAWERFRAGDRVGAEQRLGQVPPEEIFAENGVAGFDEAGLVEYEKQSRYAGKIVLGLAGWVVLMVAVFWLFKW